jgi:hypothetical protein
MADNSQNAAAIAFSEHGDKEREAMLKMTKIIIKDIEDAVKK